MQVATTINNRYTLQTPIGKGGMGTVYAAYDRLTQQTVALKQVGASAEQLAFNSRMGSQTLTEVRVALAHEFQVLASLRHPHIISVFDYGFDAGFRPYYVMPLLEHPRTLVEAARHQPLREQIELVIQTLQALTYLHRRGITHRDLKPDNVLVDASRQVRVLDFGLALAGTATQEVAGTLAYMAPEVLQGQNTTPAADLFAVGVMLYEILLGQHPFTAPTHSQFATRILFDEPELAALMGDPATRRLGVILDSLLAKDPAQRHPDARTVIDDLCRAVDLAPLPETSAIREGFLQAAPFIGRTRPLQHLTAALNDSTVAGSAWLVGGESGVGKTRLLHEVQIYALVKGQRVLWGQATEGASLPYSLWRGVVPPLLLMVAVSDDEAAVLAELVPDISTLLGRAIQAAAPLASNAHRARLVWTLRAVIGRVAEPLLLVLDDLQWADDVAMVEEIATLVQQQPLVVIGSYRNDEAPHLPDSLPAFQPMMLDRFDAEGVAALSQAMLGPQAGTNLDLVTLLTEETEGNVFFGGGSHPRVGATGGQSGQHRL